MHIDSSKHKKAVRFTFFVHWRNKLKKINCCIVMQEASDALSKTADSDTVSTYQVSSVQLVTDKKLEAFNKA